MAGLAMGMTMEGFRPVLFFERHEFVLNAMDAIVNTMDIVEVVSDGEYTMPVIIKAVSGSVKPFYGGVTHSQNLVGSFREMFSFPVYDPKTPGQVLRAYKLASLSRTPVMVCEHKYY